MYGSRDEGTSHQHWRALRRSDSVRYPKGSPNLRATDKQVRLAKPHYKTSTTATPSTASANPKHKTQSEIILTEHQAKKDLCIMATIAKPSEKGSSCLEALPNELLMTIFEELAPKEKSVDRITRPSPRSNYCDLCLVSKRIDLVARRCLFRKVSICDSLSLARLCSTIDENPNLGDKILDLSIHVLLKKANNRCNALLTRYEEAEVIDIFNSLTGERRARTHGDIDKYSDLVGILCYELLKRTCNLCSLTLVLSGYRCEMPTPYCDEEHSRQCYAELFQRVRSASQPHDDGTTITFLPKVETLTLESVGRQIHPEEFGHFLGLPSLRKLICARESEFWSCLTPHGVQSPSDSVASFYSRFSWACKGDLEDMAELFPALEELTLSFGILQSFWHIRAVPGMHRELSTALGGFTALRTLKTNSSPSADFSINFCRYMVAKSPATTPRVLNLVRLPSLRHLEVSSFIAARMSSSGFDGSTVVPYEIFPLALETLKLLAHRKCSHPHGRACWDSIAITLGILETLGRDFSSFEKLKKVGYSFDQSSCGNLTLAPASPSQEDEAFEDSIRLRLLAIDKCYSESNVEFFLQKRTSELGFERFGLQEWKQ